MSMRSSKYMVFVTRTNGRMARVCTFEERLRRWISRRSSMLKNRSRSSKNHLYSPSRTLCCGVIDTIMGQGAILHWNDCGTVFFLVWFYDCVAMDFQKAVFVANRVGEIQRLTLQSDWQHISSFDNSADLLFRGISPHEIADSALWWYSPAFLKNNEDSWSKSDACISDVRCPKFEKRSLLLTQ